MFHYMNNQLSEYPWWNAFILPLPSRDMIVFIRNPSLEDQACDRIYRVGQTKDVFIHRYISSIFWAIKHFMQYMPLSLSLSLSLQWLLCMHWYNVIHLLNRFLCKDTIEERIVALQQKKQDLAKSVLTGYVLYISGSPASGIIGL